MIFRFSHLGLSAVLLFSLGCLVACSTGMSKDECSLANWQQIGYEDGSVGQNLNYIARHRKSCSKAGVTPDFEAYKRGHSEGLNKWCNYDNGLHFGESGRRYEGICPKHLESAFLDGYDYGRRLFEARSAVAGIRNEINNSLSHIDQLEHERIDLGELIISPESTSVDRVKAVARIKDIGDEITDLELYIASKERELPAAEAALQRIQR